jgi:NAD/NADP transhydrogenase alpha subunit
VDRFAAQEQNKTLAFEQSKLVNLATLTTTTPAQADELYGRHLFHLLIFQVRQER